MSWTAAFEFFADNPPSIMIAGGVLLFLVSVLTAPFDDSTTSWLRSVGTLLVILGFLLQLLWLFRDSIQGG